MPALPPPLEAVAFDAYGTLFDVTSVIATCERRFPGRGEAIGDLWRRKQLEYSWLRALMGSYRDFRAVTGDALDYAFAALRIEADDDDRRALMDGYHRLDLYAEVDEALGALRLPKLILSNGAPAMLAAAVEHAGIGSHFDALLSADAARSFKTDPRVYRLATDHLGRPAERIGFVSSNAWDVAGAKAFGFWTCWVNRAGAPAERLGYPADLEVGDLGALVAHLTRD